MLSPSGLNGPKMGRFVYENILISRSGVPIVKFVEKHDAALRFLVFPWLNVQNFNFVIINTNNFK